MSYDTISKPLAVSTLLASTYLGNAYAYFSFSVQTTGSPSSYTVVLEGSDDNATWTPIITANTDGTQFNTGTVDYQYIRVRCTAVSGGSSPMVVTETSVYGYDPTVQPVSLSSLPPISGSVSTSPTIPIGSNILSGSATATNTTTAQTLITIPAGRTWYGTVNLAAANNGAVGSTGTATVSTAGTGVIPSAATSIAAILSATVGLSVVTDVTNTDSYGPMYIQAPAGNSVSLVLTNSTASSFTSVAIANGILL